MANIKNIIPTKNTLIDIAAGAMSFLLVQKLINYCGTKKNGVTKRKLLVVKDIAIKDVSPTTDSSNNNKIIFIIDIDNDDKLDFKHLNKIVTTILMNIADGDEIIININSPGGSVIDFFAAYDQLYRLKNHGAKINVFIQKIAASGGYLLASLGDNIYSTKDCIVGSIGAFTSGFNFSKLLKLFSIDYKTYKSCEYKNMGDPYDEMTEQTSEKIQNDVMHTHDRFVKTITENRKNLDKKLFNADIWYGDEAKDNGLVDDIKIVDDYIMDKAKEYTIYNVEFAQKKSEKLSIFDIILNFL